MLQSISEYGAVPSAYSKKTKEKASLVWTGIGLLCVLSLSLNLYSLIQSFGNERLASINNVAFGSDITYSISDTAMGYTSKLTGVTMGDASKANGANKHIVNKDNNGPIIELCATFNDELITGLGVTYNVQSNGGTIGKFEPLQTDTQRFCPCPETHGCYDPIGDDHIYGVHLVYLPANANNGPRVLGMQFIGKDTVSDYFGEHDTVQQALASFAGSEYAVYESVDRSSVIRKIRGRVADSLDALNTIEFFFGQKTQPDSTQPTTTGWQGPVSDDKDYGLKYQLNRDNNGPVLKFCVSWNADGVTGMFVGYSPAQGNSGVVGNGAEAVPIADFCVCRANTVCFAPPGLKPQIESAQVFWQNDEIVAMQVGSKDVVSNWMGPFQERVEGNEVNFSHALYQASSRRCIRKILAYATDQRLQSLDLYYGQPEQ